MDGRRWARQREREGARFVGDISGGGEPNEIWTVCFDGASEDQNGANTVGFFSLILALPSRFEKTTRMPGWRAHSRTAQPLQ